MSADIVFVAGKDPLKEKGLASRAFDGEGAAVTARKLVDDGVVTTWLLNAAAARQLSSPGSLVSVVSFK